MGASGRGDFTNGVQPVVARSERQTRLEAHVAPGEMGVATRDIGGVGEDERITLAAECVAPVALAHADVVEGELRHIAPRHRQCPRTHIRGDHMAVAAFCGDGRRHGACAGAEIGDGQRPIIRNQCQRHFHQKLGLGARNQGLPCHLQGQRPEFAHACQVGYRFTVGAACDHFPVTGGLARRNRIVRPPEQARARLFEDVREQHFGIEPRRWRISAQCGQRRRQQLTAGLRPSARLSAQLPLSYRLSCQEPRASPPVLHAATAR